MEDVSRIFFRNFARDSSKKKSLGDMGATNLITS